MRYAQPRKATESEEKKKEGQNYDKRPIMPFKWNHGAVQFYEDKDGGYTGNSPFTKQIHKRMKSYSGDKGKA